VSGHRSKTLRRAKQAVVALLLIGACSFVHAAPRVIPNATPDSHLLNTTLPVPALTKRHNLQPVPLDEPRPVPPNARERPSVAPGDAPARQAKTPLDLRWRESREIAGPEIVSLIRNYRRDGLPVVQLYQSHQSLLAIGVNPHGLPGIYFRRNVGG
jgi:hypothetical protein